MVEARTRASTSNSLWIAAALVAAVACGGGGDESASAGGTSTGDPACLGPDLGCPCQAGGCVDGLLCVDGLCGPPPGTTGTSDASTTDGVECVCHAECGGDGYFCIDGSCDFDPNDYGDAMVTIPGVPPDLALVVDKSGTMATATWDGDGDPNTPETSRWASVHAALSEALVAHDAAVNLGLVLFPALGAAPELSVAACPVADAPDVPILPANAAAVLDALPPASATLPVLAGGTPTRAALVTAMGHLDGLVDDLPRAIVLLTDGAANCSPEAADELERFEVLDAALVPLVADAAALGISTYVIGVDVPDAPSGVEVDGEPDGVDLAAFLGEIALAGGTTPFLAGDDAELAGALEAIAAATITCVVPLDPLPKYPDFVELTLGGVAYGGLLAGPCDGDGWRFADDQFFTVEFCGQVCVDFRHLGLADFLFRSPGPVIPPEPPECGDGGAPLDGRRHAASRPTPFTCLAEASSRARTGL